KLLRRKSRHPGAQTFDRSPGSSPVIRGLIGTRACVLAAKFRPFLEIKSSGGSANAFLQGSLSGLVGLKRLSQRAQLMTTISAAEPEAAATFQFLINGCKFATGRVAVRVAVVAGSV